MSDLHSTSLRGCLNTEKVRGALRLARAEGITAQDQLGISGEADRWVGKRQGLKTRPRKLQQG